MAINYAAQRVRVTAAQLADWQGTATLEALDLSGPCPTCGHVAPYEIPRQINAMESMPAPAPAPELTVDLTCHCQEDHPGRPAGIAGCGRAWLVVTAIDGKGTVSFAPPPPTAQDPRLVEARQALRDASGKQLTDLRSAAEKWIGGVTALFSLFGLAGVTVARSTVAGLVTWGQVFVGLTTAASVVLAGLAIYWIYRAAYGWPVRSDVSSDGAVLRWYETQQAAPGTQAEFLRNGVRAAGAALGVLVVTAGLLWFVPQAAAPGPLVQATLNDGSQVCGTLLPSMVGATPIVRRASDGSAVPIPVKSLVSLTAIASC